MNSCFVLSFYCQLCVHVGVYGFTDNVLLEKCAHNYGYNSPDERGNKCHHGCCVEGRFAVIYLMC